ncbi:MAG: PaaI family thioesterase [Bacillota bacterium]|nr:PaaI family thioesterase [Bacillota bacterium]
MKYSQTDKEKIMDKINKTYDENIPSTASERTAQDLDIPLSQEAMEEHLKQVIYGNNEIQKESINGMMKCSGGSCSFAEKTLTFNFPIQPWQANRVGNIHGGIICTAFDLTIAALARFYARKGFAPTVNLDVNYVRPAHIDDTLVVVAKATATGRRITQIVGEAFRKSDGKLVATASSIYMNVDTTKE